MNVCVDIGNTFIKVGFYEIDRLVFDLSLETNVKKTKDEYFISFKNILDNQKIDFSQIKIALVSSVVPSLNTTITEVIKKLFNVNVRFIEPGVKTGLIIKVDNPLEVGADLIADLVAAKEKYSYPSVIIDFGTATKILLLDKTGAFTSCILAPGLTMSAKALNKNAALLPEVGLKETKKLLQTKNTIDAINAGIIFSQIGLMEYSIREYEKELGYSLKKIITGGAAHAVLSNFKDDFIYDEHLTIDGVNSILLKQKDIKEF